MVHPVPTLIEELYVPEVLKYIVPPEQVLLDKLEIDWVPVIPELSSRTTIPLVLIFSVNTPPVKLLPFIIPW